MTGHRPRSAEILPAPFEWIDIPAGRVTLLNTWDDHTYLKKDEPTVFEVPAYSIAKYPITNAQFAPFVEAGEYQQEKWWTQAGWKRRTEDKWTSPRYRDDPTWNGADYPIIGISWYEMVAFGLWLSDITGEHIMLPTEQQWQRAAQGDDERVYPWGNDWDASRCNARINSAGIGKTTPVTHYQGKGDSPFGVVDLMGNVDEWCITAYQSGSQDIESKEERVLRGGGWNTPFEYFMRVTFRHRHSLGFRTRVRGFRIARTFE